MNTCIFKLLLFHLYILGSLSLTYIQVDSASTIDTIFTTLDAALHEVALGKDSSKSYVISIVSRSAAYPIKESHDLTGFTLTLQTATMPPTDTTFSRSSCATFAAIDPTNVTISATWVSFTALTFKTPRTFVNSTLTILKPYTLRLSFLCFQIDSAPDGITKTQARVTLEEGPGGNSTLYPFVIKAEEDSPCNLTIQGIQLYGAVAFPFFLWSTNINVLTMRNFQATSFPRMMIPTNQTDLVGFTVSGEHNPETELNDASGNPCLVKMSYYSNMKLDLLTVKNFNITDPRFFFCLYQKSPPEEIILNPAKQNLAISRLTIKNNTFVELNATWGFIYTFTSSSLDGAREITFSDLNIADNTILESEEINAFVFVMDLAGNLTMKDIYVSENSDLKIMSATQNNNHPSNLAKFQNATFIDNKWLEGDQPIIYISINPRIYEITPSPTTITILDVFLHDNHILKDFFYVENFKGYKDTLNAYVYPRSSLLNILAKNNTVMASNLFTIQRISLDFNHTFALDNTLYAATFLKSSSGPSPLNVHNFTFQSSNLNNSNILMKQFDTSKIIGGINTESGNNSMTVPYSAMITHFYLRSSILSDDSVALNFKGAPIIFVKDCFFKDVTFAQSSTLLRASDLLSSAANAMLNSTSTLQKYIGYLNLVANQNLTSAYFRSLPINPTEFRLGYCAQAFTKGLTFIYRVFDSTFENLTFTSSNLFDVSSVSLNQSLVSVDQNSFSQIVLSSFQDSLINAMTIRSMNFAWNKLQNVDGIGVAITSSQVQFMTIYSNEVRMNNGTSFLRYTTDINQNFLIENNTMENISSLATFIKMEIEKNNGQVFFHKNNFTKFHISSDSIAYRQLNFLSIDTQSATVIPNTPGVYIKQCLFNDMVLYKNHRLIKQYQNAFLFSSLSQDQFVIENSKFQDISVRYDNNLLFIVADKFKILDSFISDIENYEKYGSLYLLCNTVYINNSQFINNWALPARGGGIFIDFDSVEGTENSFHIENSVFKNMSASEGSAIYVSKKTLKFRANNNNFIDCMISQDSGSALAFVGTVFSEFVFLNNNITYTQDLKYTGTKLVLFDSTQGNAEVTDLSIFLSGALTGTMFAVQSTNSNFLFDKLKIYDQRAAGAVNSFSIMELASGSMTLTGAVIEGLTSDMNSLISLVCNKDFNANLWVKDSTFKNIMLTQSGSTSTTTGIIHINSKGSKTTCNQTVQVTQTTFEKLNYNTAGDLQSSAVSVDYIGKITLTVANCNFYNIIAAKGPAISLLSSPRFSNSITISLNIFTNTTAKLDGGAIYSNNDLMQINGNYFVKAIALAGNGAAVFSKVAASNLADIVLRNTFVNCLRYGNLQNQSLADSKPVGTNPTRLRLNFDLPSYIRNDETTLTLTNFSSHDLSKMNVTSILIDALDQIVYDMTVSESNPRILEISILGSSVDSRNCTFQQCFLGGPTLPIIAAANESIAAQMIYKSEAFQVSKDFSIVLRHCIDGEINTTLVNSKNPPQCNPCAVDTYSINTLTDKECKPCKAHATCPGANVLVLDPGYWRFDHFSDIILECTNANACLGGFESTCKTGFTGPLCDSCDLANRYVKNGENCSKCPDGKQSLVLSTIVLCAVLMYQIFYIKTVRTSNSYFIAYFGEKPDQDHGVRVRLIIDQGMYIRLLMTYYQIISIIATFQLDFSMILGPLWHSASSVKSSSSSVYYANQCSLLDLGFKPNQLLYIEIMLITLSPLVKILFLSVFRVFKWKFRMNDKRISIVMVTVICLIMLEQPNIAERLFSFLSCTTLEGDDRSFLQKDLGIECYTPQYNLFRNFFVYPALAFYVLVVPIAIFRILFKNRKNINSLNLRMNLGAIYNEYHPRAFFWGVFLMVTKIVLMYFGSILYNDVKTKALSVFIVLYIYYGLYLRFHPYDRKDLYQAEKIALITYLFTIFGSIYYKDNTLPIVQWITICIIAMLNCYTLALLVYRMAKVNLVQLKVFTVPQLLKKLKTHEKPKDLDVNFLDQGFDFKRDENGKEEEVKEEQFVESLEQVEDKLYGKDEDPPEEENEKNVKKIHGVEMPIL